jgi:hypothetical protein
VAPLDQHAAQIEPALQAYTANGRITAATTSEQQCAALVPGWWESKENDLIEDGRRVGVRPSGWEAVWDALRDEEVVGSKISPPRQESPGQRPDHREDDQAVDRLIVV